MSRFRKRDGQGQATDQAERRDPKADPYADDDAPAPGDDGSGVAAAAKALETFVPRTPDDVDIDPKGERLGELLLKRDLIGRGQLIEAILQQDASGVRLGEILVSSGSLSEMQLTEVVAEQAGVKVLDVRTIEVDPAAVEKLSETLARSLRAIPYAIGEDGILDVAVADPSPELERRLEEATGSPVRIFAANPSAVRRILDTTHRAVENVPQFVQRFQAADAIRHAVDAIPDEADVSDAPVVQVVNLIITQALRDRASDIHLEPADTHVRLRYRIDGALHDLMSLPATMALALVSRLKIMAGLNIVERRRPQDGQISMELEGRELDIRVAVAPTIWGEKAVLRLLDKSRPLFHYDELGMSPEIEKQFLEVIRSPYGMVVCSGPTGSGKTTTLYATLLALNNTEMNITTIEDPVEYILPAINQIQVNPTADVTFATGLRSVLRQDPDIILVGETRDTETAAIAVRAALTGHLVLSSIHATDSASATQRFIEMGVEPFLLTSSLMAVVAQRLVRRICTYCRTTYKPSADELAFYRNAGGEAKTIFYYGEGCNFCARSGYLGRVGVFELLVLSEEIRALIVAGGSRDQIRALAVAQGMSTLRQEGLKLVGDDETTIAEVVRHIWTM